MSIKIKMKAKLTWDTFHSSLKYLLAESFTDEGGILPRHEEARANFKTLRPP